ncbi:zinc finger protein draculin-like [Plodia interpunctella]|uniref:zinc finger protein draculin-like n=1 Tax=Plodia interpunctella TaxID=58824 RepID=UPI00236878E8|nr:zinc finger protein draculin-like [Plodia interpunctella]
MEAEIMVEALPLLGICNLCLNEGVVKSMLLTQSLEGSKQTYIEMLYKCFSIDVLLLPLGDTKRLICELCIARLLESLKFKEQVEVALSNLQAIARDHRPAKEYVPLTDVKKETSDEADDDLDSHFCEEDDIALTEFQVKLELKEEMKSKKSIVKSTMKYAVKKKDLDETESMLRLGLFPFKLKKNNTFSCAICPEKFKNLDDLKKHIVEHKPTNIHVAFKKSMFSNAHRYYKSGNVLRCKICTTDIRNYDELKNHMVNCSQLKFSKKWNNLPFKLEKDQLDCPICKKTFLNYVNLNTHMNVHYPNYICENCGKAFASKARLRGHMRTHEVGHFPCRHCDAVFDRVTKRENHVSKEHKAGVRYACKRCNISLTSFYARQKHLAEVHNEELKRYKCKACPQSYITPGHLSSHVRRDHLHERNHKCDKCDLAFYTKNALKMHMIKHDGERIHTCHICQKSYQRKKTLREHMRIHNNDKRFVCPVCGRAFTQKCTLKGHLKVHDRKLDLDDRMMQPLHSI